MPSNLSESHIALDSFQSIILLIAFTLLHCLSLNIFFEIRYHSNS